MVYEPLHSAPPFQKEGEAPSPRPAENSPADESAENWGARVAEIDEALFSVDRMWRFTAVNRRVATLWGRREEELLGKVLWEAFPTLCGSPFEPCYRQAMADGNATRIEAFSETAQAWYEVRVYPIIPGLIVMFVDITARKQLELALQASEARFRALSTATFEGVVIHDTHVVIDANEAAVALYGYNDVHGLIGQPIRALITPDSWNAVDAHMVNDGEGVYECTAVRSDGSTFPIEARASWTTYGGKQVRIGAFRDLTEHKRAEAQRIQLEKRESVSRLARGIAHDFSTLLTVITLGSEEVLSQLSHDDVLAADMEAIRHAAEQAVALTRQLSALSRDDTRTHTPLHLSRVVAAMEGVLHRLLGSHIIYEARLDEQLCPILADASQLEQVVLNLVINARDAMPDGGHLRITTTQVDAAPQAGGVGPAQATDATCVQLVVQDTGMGMDADTQAQIFEPFFTTKPPGRGTGLGLAIIHAIVLQYGGTIDVSSTPGQGTRFTVTFPTSGDSSSPPPPIG